MPLALGLVVGIGLALPATRVGLLVWVIGERKGAMLGIVAAGAVAVVDVLFASLAAQVGGSVAGASGTARLLLDVIAAGVLVGIAARELIWRLLLGPTGIPPNAVLQDGAARTFAQLFVIRGLQVVVLFATLAAAIGLPEAVAVDEDRVRFVIGIGAVALGWRLALVWLGISGRRLGAAGQRALTIAGAAVLVTLAIGIAGGWLPGS